MSLRAPCLALIAITLVAAPVSAQREWPDERGARHDSATAEKAYRWYLEGRTLARRQHLDAAAEALEAACDLAPQEGRYQLLLGRVLRDNGDPRGAIAHLKWAYETGDDKVQAEAAGLLQSLSAPVGGLSGRDTADSSPPSAEAKPEAKPESSKPEAKAEAPAAGPASLYKRLGGAKAIKAVVGDFIGRVGKDKRINSFFATTNLENLKSRLVEQIGQAAGGPEVYKGKSMKEVHKGLGIKAEHFDALVEDLAAALKKFRVGDKEQEELLSVLMPMKADIVE